MDNEKFREFQKKLRIKQAWARGDYRPKHMQAHPQFPKEEYMRRVCSWCGKDMGETVEPGEGITHGICADCAVKTGAFSKEEINTLWEQEIAQAKYKKPKIVFETLSPKEKSAALQEQGNEIAEEEKEEGYCPRSLIDLRDWLREQITDEQRDSNSYKWASEKMDGFQLPTWVSALESISRDEGEHQAILEIIVDVITKKCGE